MQILAHGKLMLHDIALIQSFQQIEGRNYPKFRVKIK